jgi:hypothetical protein
VRVHVLDLAAPIIGSLFVAIGAAAAAAALSARPRINRSAAWFAVFCVLYGVRLLSRSMLVHVVTGWPDAAFAYISASITYAILAPATLFVESIGGPGKHGLIHRTWQPARRLRRGLTEAIRGNSDEFFGDAELGRVVSSTQVSDDLLRTVLDAHRRWIGEGTAVSDDISIVVIESVEQGVCL